MKIWSIFLAVVAVLFLPVNVNADDEHTGTKWNIDAVVVSNVVETVMTTKHMYKVKAVLCDDQNQQNGPPFTQGTMIHICLTPDVFATGAGIMIDSIDEFTWTRSDNSAISQQAIIRANTPSNNGLTILTNTHGDGTEYRLESVLLASFYATAGAVTGTGRATLANAAASSSESVSESGEDIKMQSTFSIKVEGISKKQQAYFLLPEQPQPLLDNDYKLPKAILE